MIAIHQWKDLSTQFADTLLVGNGASIALDSCFCYNSLLEHARDHANIADDVQAVFDHFKTTDFEHVMRMLWHAFNVNQALAISDSRTKEAYANLREALIAAVREIHVAHANVEGRLDAIQSYMAGFATVLSLNYDLIVYWAMLRGNAERQGRWFKDCWLSSEFEDDWRKLRAPYGTDRTTLVFYPHGNLILASHPTKGELKLAADSGASLLDQVFDAWTTDDCIPLFVSEGESRQKEAAIGRHAYLNTVYSDVMMNLGESVAVYGWAVSDNDEHILRRLCAPSTRRIAISVYKSLRSVEEIDLSCQAIQLKVKAHNPRIEVLFFDAGSAACWANPPVA